MVGRQAGLEGDPGSLEVRRVAGKPAPASLPGAELAARSWLGLPPTMGNERQRGRNANNYRLHARNRISRELAVR